MANVLLIEPDRVLGRTYAQALEHVGHIARLVADAQEAVEAADTQKPDVVVLELQLVGHGGIEFLHEFRSYSEWQQIPIIINTLLPPLALAPVQAALENELGVKACLYKPRTSLAQLIRTINDQGEGT